MTCNDTSSSGKDPGVRNSIKFALLAAVATFPAAIFFRALIPLYPRFFLIFLLAGAGYLAFLLAGRQSKRGNALCFTTYAAMTAGGILFPSLLPAVLFLAMIHVWLVRVGTKYNSIFPVIFDGAVGVAGLSIALPVVIMTHSMALTIWVFFLVQSLTAFIPGKTVVAPAVTATGTSSNESKSRFDQAMRAAEDAVSAINRA